MRKLLDEIRAAIKAAPSEAWEQGDSRAAQGAPVPMAIRSWHGAAGGWTLLVAAVFKADDKQATWPCGPPDGTAVRGGPIVHLTPELAAQAYKKARGG